MHPFRKLYIYSTIVFHLLLTGCAYNHYQPEIPHSQTLAQALEKFSSTFSEKIANSPHALAPLSIVSGSFMYENIENQLETHIIQNLQQRLQEDHAIYSHTLRNTSLSIFSEVLLPEEKNTPQLFDNLLLIVVRARPSESEKAIMVSITAQTPGKKTVPGLKSELFLKTARYPALILSQETASKRRYFYPKLYRDRPNPHDHGFD